MFNNIIHYINNYYRITRRRPHHPYRSHGGNSHENQNFHKFHHENIHNQDDRAVLLEHNVPPQFYPSPPHQERGKNIMLDMYKIVLNHIYVLQFKVWWAESRILLMEHKYRFLVLCLFYVRLGLPRRFS